MALYTNIYQKNHLIFFVSFSFLVLTFLFQKFYKSNLLLTKKLFILSVNIFLFFLAFESSFFYCDKNNPSHYSNFLNHQHQQFEAIIDEIPIVSEQTIKLYVTVNAIDDHTKWHYATGKTIVYVRQDSSIKLNVGDKLLIRSRFSYLTEPKNPNEFNYKEFLESKNIYHTVFAQSKNTSVINERARFHYSKIGVYIKSRLVSILRYSGLSQEAFSICSALLVGYDDEIDSDIIQSFSHSGTLHILSVSGMHTGVLYAVLIFLFSLFDKYDNYKKTKFAFVMLFLWLFVLVTGFSPSILRAAIMLSLVLFGKTFYKQGNSYNTLLLSAFIILLFNPYLIKDVGFLLSYSAVFGIMYLYPKLQRLYVFDNRILQTSWSGVLMSVSATFFTLPISLYFFHQFPLWFVFSNMIIIPISLLIMGASALILVFFKIAIVSNILVYIINIFTAFMLWLAQLTDNPTYGYIDFISFSKTDFCFLTATLILFLIFISTKSYKQVVVFGLLIISWISSSVIINYNNSHQKELVVFHVKQQSVFALRVGHTVYGNFKNIPKKDFERYVKPYLLNYSNLKLVAADADAFKTDSVLILRNYSNSNLQDLNPNVVLVSHDKPIELVTNHKTKPIVIADCSNSYKFVKKLKKQCAQFDIPFYSVKENGAFKVNL
ncbi:MAG TPA: ComEC/Rec2 family competence protein [Bacteroidia bacterium]|nr:ComEC/Rec2 family competence protein [Bacteroidia bacterium]